MKKATEINVDALSGLLISNSPRKLFSFSMHYAEQRSNFQFITDSLEQCCVQIWMIIMGKNFLKLALNPANIYLLHVNNGNLLPIKHQGNQKKYRYWYLQFRILVLYVEMKIFSFSSSTQIFLQVFEICLMKCSQVP